MSNGLVYYGLGSLVLYWCIKRYRYLNELPSIPTVGPSGFFSSFSAAVNYLKNSRDIIDEGYRQYPDKAFKVYTPEGWLIFVSGGQPLADAKKAPDEQLSFLDAVNETMQMEHTLGKELAYDMYHIHTIRTSLTRNIGARFPDVCDELQASYDELIPAKEDGWITLPMMDTVMQVIARASNRFFVGLPVCRDKDYIKLNIEYTISVAKAAMLIRFFPGPLKGLAARFLTDLESSYKRARSHLEPMLTERLEKDNEYGMTWEGRPNDYISWLLETAKGSQRSVRDLVLRVIGVNFAAIHTSSMGTTHAIYDLAAHPQWIAPLREEIDQVGAEHGWTKASMQKLRKLDSFLKESQRMWGLGTVTSTRTVLKDFTFSNGQVIPAGHTLTVAQYSVHHDETIYPNADEFRPFRFSDMREAEGEGVHHQLISSSNEYLPFGVGRHACPGRFFAGNEIKLALALLIANYDMKMEEEGVRPPNMNIGSSMSPNRTAKVMFRKRSTA